jgi:hypothetical protein
MKILLSSDFTRQCCDDALFVASQQVGDYFIPKTCESTCLTGHGKPFLSLTDKKIGQCFRFCYTYITFYWKSESFLVFSLKNSLLVFSSACLIATTAKKRTGTDEKAEIVPKAIIVDFINPNRIAKPGNDKGEYGDEAVPEPTPKTGNTSFWSGHILHCIRPGRAANQS